MGDGEIRNDDFFNGKEGRVGFRKDDFFNGKEGRVGFRNDNNIIW